MTGQVSEQTPLTEVARLGAVGAAKVVAELRVRHVVAPRAAVLGADGETEALRRAGTNGSQGATGHRAE